MLEHGQFIIHVLPRVTWTWEEFLANTPHNAVALDGMVRGGPQIDVATRRVNFDHHEGVIRDITMSTAMQIYVAIKGGLMRFFRGETVHVYINDPDQDTSYGTWLLIRHKLFEGVQSIPHISRLVHLNDKLDITGGAFPMSLDDQLVRQHAWLSEPYTSLRKSGALATANEAVIEGVLEATLARLDRFLVNEGGEAEPDVRHEVLFRHPEFMVVDEIGGSEARWHLFSQGMQAFVSIVARRPDGRIVYSLGRRSRWVPFPVCELYDALNAYDGLTTEVGWGGSDIVGGSSRLHGSGLSWETVRDIVVRRLNGGSY